MGLFACEPCVSVALPNKETALYCVRRMPSAGLENAGETLLSDPETHSCLLPPPTAGLCQHHGDGHPQVPKREEPTPGKKGEEHVLLFSSKSLTSENNIL